MKPRDHSLAALIIYRLLKDDRELEEIDFASLRRIAIRVTNGMLNARVLNRRGVARVEDDE